MNKSLPITATLLGVAGLLPFVATGLAALGPQGDRAMLALVAYGAVILAFLGGVHWGFALEGRRRPQRTPAPALESVVPSLIGWVAMLLAIAVSVEAAILLLVIAFIGTTAVEARAQRAGLMPRGYMALRYGLSTGVVLVLAITLFNADDQRPSQPMVITRIPALCFS